MFRKIIDFEKKKKTEEKLEKNSTKVLKPPKKSRKNRGAKKIFCKNF